jgi:hypothetical protein
MQVDGKIGRFGRVLEEMDPIELVSMVNEMAN